MRFSPNRTALWLFLLPALLVAGAAAPDAAHAQLCSISGPATLCDGPAELCAPEWGSEFEWTGPDGFIASARCVTVNAPGTYSVRVFDGENGLWMGPCSHTVLAGDCGGDRDGGMNCPRTAHFWWRQCVPLHPKRQRVDRETLARVAACVDQRMEAFSWGGSLEGFAATLSPPCQYRPRGRAHRQVAALVANVCVGGMEVVTRGGQPVRLNPSTPVVWDGRSMTLGEWLDVADEALVSLDDQKLTQRVKKAYHAIAAFARGINRGQGIGPVCGAPPMTSAEAAEEDAND